MSNLDFSAIPPSRLQDVLDGPALPPPEGVVPDFDNPPNRSAMALGALFTCLILATVFLAIRIYARFFVVKSTHLGDYLVIPAYVFFVLVATGSLRRILGGPGIFVHQWNIRAGDMTAYLYVCFIGTSFYGSGMLLMKWAILWEWIRVFVPRHSRNGFYWACQAVIAINMVFYLTAIILTNLACRPYRRNWDKTVPGTCMDIRLINLTTAVINLVVDMVILALPQKVIWDLQMSGRKRAGISLIFAIGIVACVSAACRIQAATGWLRSDDMTYHFSSVALWASAELACGILVFSIPAVPKAFAGLKVPGWLSSLMSRADTVTRGTRRRSRDSWPGLAVATPGGPRHYRHISDDNKLSLVNITNVAGAQQADQGVVAGPEGAHILRTTSFVATVDYEHNPPQDMRSLQHPWRRENQLP
ncbi:hypothetical protein DL766_007550 [Monosporascus sp. MC13-8B]|uniref:Rhodopsin domain-containing protein n=1 Tax=Monosporascus cannonballus TaxID=155416 RepID=A0ABY0HL33_9PEZI|nr:hypothetical protein DL762_000236 [Monosporascus cannonballus]RYO99372.1 hypothetical protein DL763_001546 [Monosporascus cannonballus]RYP23133.1 hypothetical protein DL766_007550 [Monosporascus sp. MC13-8B]